MKTREPIVLSLLLLMLAGCLWLRVLLSVSMILFILLNVLHSGIFLQVKKTISNPLTAGIMIFFFIPFISGLWSSDLVEWKDVMQDKLPFLLLPIAFNREWKIKERHWELFFQAALLLLVISTFWSIQQYLVAKETIELNYLKSKMIPVPVFGDHIRYSWLICAGFIATICLSGKAEKKKLQLIYFAIALWFFVYLHILAARTGLAGCYFFILIWALHLLFRKRKKKIFYVSLLVVVAIVLSAWSLFPTLRNRIRYMKYNLSFIAKGEYLPHSNDGNRRLSFLAGWSILKKHPMGVGAGDVKGLVSKWYDEHIADVTEDDKIFPANEWLIYGDFAGWPGFIAFTIAFFAPLLQMGGKNRIFGIGLLLSALVACFFDSSFEGQTGVFIYCFTTLLWWKRSLN